MGRLATTFRILGTALFAAGALLAGHPITPAAAAAPPRNGGPPLHIPSTIKNVGTTPQRRPDVDVRLSKLGLVGRLLHTAASPSVAYLLVIVGLLLAVFEFFTAGIGIAAAVGAG